MPGVQPSPPTPAVTSLRGVAAGRGCEFCGLRPRCLPAGLEGEHLAGFARAMPRARRLRAGEHLFRVGDPFESLFAVSRGCLKSYAVDAEGREHVLNFYFPGELAGADAIYPEQHMANAIALEDSVVCVLSYRTLGQLAVVTPELQQQLLRLVSRDLFSMATIAGDFTAEERLAAFLVMVSARLRGSGDAPTRLDLAMSRQDIASYLRLATETVSRILARFQRNGLLKADRRRILLIDPAGLYEIAACMNPYARCAEDRRPRHVRPFRSA
ncbi:MAG: helix-turn-helix domain-containing protein [Chromatiales bacterium]|nr:helix-turn-helix domain-containing protein [Chromatiales bacterium]